MFSSTPIGIALRIALIYILIGGLWILGSDQLMAIIFSDPDTLVRISMYKGWFYVAVTGCLLFFLVLGSTSRSINQHIKLHGLLDNIPDFVWLKDGNGVYLACNPPCEHFFGAKESEIVGKTDYNFFPRETADLFRKKDEEVIAADRPQKNREWITLASNGQQILLETIKKPMKDEKGRILGVLSIGRDITALDKAKTTARDVEDKFRALFEYMALGSCLDEIIYDNNGCAVDYRVIDVNPAYEKLIGISKTQAAGMLASELYGNGTAPNIDIYDQVDKTGKPATFETFFPPTGKHLLITASRISKGRFCTIFSDITERLKLEAQIRQAQKMESVGQLAGGVAHDYNNMLAVIFGHAEMAISRVDSDDKLHSHLEIIIDAARRSTEITRQLLAFARKQTISPKIIDINKTVESMLKMLKRLIGENIELLWEPKEELWSIKMDPSQLDQILANLCVNARDAIAGTGKITIRTNNVVLDESFCVNNIGSTPGEYVLFALRDDGCGMNKETIDKIFEPFFTTKEESKGTGLGLSTVYGIVKQNKGFIYVNSELEQGTTFSIYLPRNNEKATELESGITDETNFGRGETILLVEDEEANLEMLKSLLEGLGYNVFAAKVPANALEIANIHKEDIDLLITDVIMPDMAGNELSAQLSNIIPNIKTLFMSGHAFNVVLHQGVLIDGVNFIQKPFSTKELSIKIRSILDT